MTAIIVDDNEAHFVLVREILLSLHWEAIHSPRGHLTERLIAQYEPSLVLMDISLPDGSGIDFTRSLRLKGIDVPLIIMSAHTFPEMTKIALEAGATAFFEKPFELEELERILIELTAPLSDTIPFATPLSFGTGR